MDFYIILFLYSMYNIEIHRYAVRGTGLLKLSGYGRKEKWRVNTIYKSDTLGNRKHSERKLFKYSANLRCQLSVWGSMPLSSNLLSGKR